MAPRATQSAPAEQEAAREIDYEAYKTKAPTDLQERFVPWLTDKVGIDPNSDFKSKAHAFAEGVRLAVALRIPFQASDENRAATEQARANREQARAQRQAAPAQETTEAAPQRVKRGGRRAAAQAAPEPATEAPAAPPAQRRGRRASTTREAAF